ncbi:MAG: hypothetical protein ACPG4N_09945, partial [Gammaproteobacteria bacterium]
MRLIAAMVMAAAPGQPLWADANTLEAIKNLKPNTALDIGAFEWEKPAGGPKIGSVLDYSGMVYDPHHNRMLVFGGGHSTTWTDAVYALDLTTFQWTSLYQPSPYAIYQPDNMQASFWKDSLGPDYPRPVGRHSYDLLVVPQQRKELFMLRAGTAGSKVTNRLGFKTYDSMMGGAWGVMDLQTHQWETIPRINNDFGRLGGVAEYDPISEKIIVLGVRQAYAVDVETREAEVIIPKLPVSAYSGSMVYCPEDDSMIGIS